MSSAKDLQRAIIAANPHLSRFNPLDRILFHDDFDFGVHGWCELIGNHDGNLDKVRTVMSDFRPPQLSNCTFFDIGTHDVVSGNYALKLQTRPIPGHMALAIKRLTSVKPGLVQFETYFTIKSEAWVGARADRAYDGNADPSQADFGDFTISNDISNGSRRAHCCMRYVNSDEAGNLVQKWQVKTSLQTSTKMEWDGLAPPATDYHVRDPKDWIDVPGGDQKLCYNEIPTKINWHYLRWQFHTGTFKNVEMQVNDKIMDLSSLPVPEYPRDFYHGLTNLLNFSVDVRTLRPVRNFIWFDSMLASVDW